jgi:hypothetical protein
MKKMKEEYTKDIENLRKKESNRNKMYSIRLLQQTRKSGRQNLRT